MSKNPNSILCNKETTSKSNQIFFFFLLFSWIIKQNSMPRRSRGISFSGTTIQQLSLTASAHTGQHSSPLRGTHSFSVGATTSTEVLSLVQVQEEKELNKSNLYLSSTYSPNRHGLRVPPSLMQGYDPKAKTTCMYEGRILTNPRTIHSQSQIQ